MFCLRNYYHKRDKLIINQLKCRNNVVIIINNNKVIPI